MAVAVVRQTMPPKWNCAFQLPHGLGLLLECIFGLSIPFVLIDVCTIVAMQLRSTGSMGGKSVQLCVPWSMVILLLLLMLPLFNMSDARESAIHYEQQRIVSAGAGGSSAVSL